jgi:hypothetical protein
MARPKPLYTNQAPDTGNRISLNGILWDIRVCKWVLKCWSCHRLFYSSRPHTATCSAACRKERSRRIGGFGDFERGKKLT